MTVGTDTYISGMLPYFGYENAVPNALRYPEITPEEMMEYNPDVILLSSEPFPFAEKHIEELAKELPEIEIKIVDGEKHSWYGSRLVRSLESLKANPE
jgi:ABC-type Fe3+-hydroxamate transport system substrate-binding protein